MLFFFIAFIVGLFLLYFESQNRKKREGLIAQVVDSIHSDQTLENDQKQERIRRWFMENGYLVEKNESGYQASRKEFSLGWLLIGGSVALLGALLYLLYYFKWLSPRTYSF